MKSRSLHFHPVRFLVGAEQALKSWISPSVRNALSGALQLFALSGTAQRDIPPHLLVKRSHGPGWMLSNTLGLAERATVEGHWADAQRKLEAATGMLSWGLPELPERLAAMERVGQLMLRLGDHPSASNAAADLYVALDPNDAP